MVRKTVVKTVTTRRGRPRKGHQKRRGRTGLGRGLLNAPDIHRFVRSTSYSNIPNITVDATTILKKQPDGLQLDIPAGTGIQYGAGSMYFTLNSLPDYTEFENLFDAYRIEAVSIRFTPFFSGSLTGAAVGATVAQAAVLWHDIVDHDDADVITPVSDAGLQKMRQYKSYKTRLLSNGRSFSRKLIPRAALPAYAAGVFTAYTQAPQKTWFDMSSTNTQFYGYKFMVECNQPGGGLFLWIKCEVKMKISCRGVR